MASERNSSIKSVVLSLLVEKRSKKMFKYPGLGISIQGITRDSEKFLVVYFTDPNSRDNPKSRF